MKTFILIFATFLFSCQKYKTCSCHAVLTDRKANGISVPDYSYESEYPVLGNKDKSKINCRSVERNDHAYQDTIKYTYHIKSDCVLK